MLKILVLVSNLLGLIYGATIPGQCDNNLPMQTFNANDFQGQWYLIEVSSSPPASCMKFNAVFNNDRFDVTRSQVSQQTLQSTNQVAELDPSGGGILSVYETSSTNQETTPVWILTTDYTNYALLYTCRNVDTTNMEVTSWKMSKSNALTSAAAAAINSHIQTIASLSTITFQQVDQSATACFHLPAIAPGADVVLPGPCDPNLAAVPNFDAQRYAGRWRLIESYHSRFQTGACNEALYTPNADGSIAIVNSMVEDRTLMTRAGTARLSEGDTSGRLNVFIGSETNPTPLWILGTDYESFALAYSCSNVGTDERRVTAWKLSRENTLSTTANTQINQIMAGIDVLDQRYFTAVDRSAAACFHLPAIAPGADVVLPGQCDPNLAAVPNFDAQRYAGRWRLIESYHSRFQSGACNEALYTPNADGSIAIVNSMVEDRTLMTRAGTARLSEGDTSGRLNVFIGSETNPTPLWILGTDYDSFALAYSCSNVGTDERRVTAWKLSRENTLSTTANTQINQIMAGIDVLDQRYFTAVDRSAAACFHLPAIAPGADVVLPGQCDPNLAAVPNFDAQRYAGRWRLIESYHSRFQSGACNEARYAPNEDGSIAIMNSMIVDQSMVVRLGVARISADDNSGKLAVFIGSETDPTPLWILDTDYESYALAYSCENVDDKQRRVTAWKLSRANTLSPTANTQINQVMAGIDVLDQRYFTAVDRSAAACFYYPEEMGERIVLPGQCDLQIPVQKEFDMSAFSGTWYQMERYPYPEVSAESSCIASRLTYDAAEGAVSISNWEVNDGQLNTIEGQATVDAATASLEVTIDESKAKIQVLKTDYSAYALLYTCVNVDEEHRAVVAFKLSRGRTMKEESSAAINEYMAHPDRVELHQPLFIQVEQSEDCPEPSSSYIIRSSLMVLLMSYFIHLFV